MRDSGNLLHCLEIEFTRKDGVIYAFQARFIDDTLETRFHEDMQPDILTRSVSYQNLFGALMYLAVGNKSDICHSVSYLSQFNTCFKKDYYQESIEITRRR